VAAAGVLGSFFGLEVVLVMGLLDRTLHTRKQVESTPGLAVLSEIPVSGDGKRGLGETLFVTPDPGSLVSEGIRSLRTSLSAHAPRSVMVTSASTDEGKSVCAANLALLQANMGFHTLLVDAHFRKPRMASIFLDPVRGKAGQGNLATQGFCQETAHKNLFLISCWRFASDAGEPMSGEIFARMLHEAYNSVDCVIIDTSPILAASDGLNYSRHADAVVLVVRAGGTRADSAHQAMRELQRMRASLVGVVLNGTDGSSHARTSYVKSTTHSLPGPLTRSPVPAGGPVGAGVKFSKRPTE